MTPAELKEFVVTLGAPAYRADQIFSWLSKGVHPMEMPNLPKAFRETLTNAVSWKMPQIAEKYVSREDGTVKYLLALEDGECVECVFMEYHHGNTLCVSSQAGCRMGYLAVR